MERLSAAVSDQRSAPVTEIRDAILARVRAFMHVQEDDMTLIVARYLG